MEADKIYAPHATFNASTLANIKFLSACFTGAISGILGLEKQYGFALFALSSIITALSIYALHMPKAHSITQLFGRSTKGSGPTQTYAPGGAWDILNPGQENVFSFLLLWTLFFGEWPVPGMSIILFLTIFPHAIPGLVHGKLPYFHGQI